MKTAQEAFLNLYEEGLENYGAEESFVVSCNEFKKIYNLVPPYRSLASVKVILSSRR